MVKNIFHVIFFLVKIWEVSSSGVTATETPFLAANERRRPGTAMHAPVIKKPRNTEESGVAPTGTPVPVSRRRPAEEIFQTPSKKTCNTAGSGFSLRVVLLEILSTDPTISLDQILVQVEQRASTWTVGQVEAEYEKLMRLTWVPDIVHGSLLAIASGDRVDHHLARLTRFCRDNAQEKLRIDTWNEFCITRLSRAWANCEPCSFGPSPWLGDENMQWSLAPNGMREVFRRELEKEQPRCSSLFGRKTDKRRRSDSISDDENTKPSNGEKKVRPWTTTEVRDIVQQYLATHEILVDEHMRDYFDYMGIDLDVADEHFKSLMALTRIDRRLHETLLPINFEPDIVESILLLHLFDPEQPEIDLGPLIEKAERWLTYCIEPLRVWEQNPAESPRPCVEEEEFVTLSARQRMVFFQHF